MLGGDELEVDGMHQGPDLPGSLTGGEQVILDLVANGGKGISIAQAQVGEKDSHKEGAPQGLVNKDLEGDNLARSTFDFAVQPVVKVVTRGTVVQETKGRQGDESLHVKRSTTDKDLQKNQYKQTRHVT